jgi:hypothetical protein
MVVRLFSGNLECNNMHRKTEQFDELLTASYGLPMRKPMATTIDTRTESLGSCSLYPNSSRYAYQTLQTFHLLAQAASQHSADVKIMHHLHYRRCDDALTQRSAIEPYQEC